MGNAVTTPTTTTTNTESRQFDIETHTRAAATLATGATMLDNQQRQFNESTRLLRATNEQLKKRRKPVQPSGELAEEQSRIRNIISKNALFIQIVLFLVFLCAVAYLMLPLETANYASLAILSIAVIYRIFFVQ
jgi:hypothetical protein